MTQPSRALWTSTSSGVPGDETSAPTGRGAAPRARATSPTARAWRCSSSAARRQAPTNDGGAPWAAIAEATKGRIAEPLRKGFDELQHVPVEMRRVVLLKALATPEAAAAWTRVCPAGPSALADVARLRREEQFKHL